MIQIIAAAAGAALGGVFKPLSDPVSRKLLTRRGKEFQQDRKAILIQALLSAVLGGWIGFQTGFSMQSLYLLVLLFAGNIISTTDLTHRVIPNDMVLALIGIKLVFGALSLLKVGNLPSWNPLMSLAGFAVLWIIFFLPALFGGKIGYGDIKLAMAIGFSSELMPGLMAICLMGFLVLGYGMLQRQVPLVGFLKTKFPMGPFLCAAQVAALLLYV